MRILYHHRTLSDGAEGIHIAAMVEAFRSLGHEVRVSGPSGLGGEPLAGRAQRMRQLLPEVAVQLGAIGYNAGDYFSICREILAFRPDLIYKRHARYDLAALAAARRRSVPTVLEVNAVYSASPYRDFEPLLLQPLAERLERRAFTLATALVAVSTPMAKQITRLAGREALVLPNAADTTRFDPDRADAGRVRAKYNLGGAVVGWSGILRDWHGVDLLLDACRRLPTVTLLLVGDGPARSAIERRAAAYDLSKRVVLTGRVAHAEMPEYIAAMDVAVVADDRTLVASPMKLAEYMAMERAVVAPDVENLRELIEHERTGLLFDRGQPAALADAVQRLLQDNELRARLGRCGRARIIKTRTWRSNALAVLDLLDNRRERPLRTPPRMSSHQAR
jgi:glycosyltransferase involved in cell wall biosynthesis